MKGAFESPFLFRINKKKWFQIIHFIFFKRHKNLTVQLIFIIVACLIIIYPLEKGIIITSDDTTFNVQRLTEIYKSLLHMQLPQFSSFSAYPMGIATASMYPWLFFAIFTPLSLFLKPVELWFSIIFIGMIMGQNIAYFCFKKVEHSRKLGAVLFALLYCNSYVLMGWMLHNSDLATVYAMFFVPLVFMGWIEYQKSNHWKIMVIGLLLMASCHVLTTLAMIICLLIATAIAHEDFQKGFIKQGVKASIIFILSDAIMWIPVLVLMIRGKALPPYTQWSSNDAWLFPSFRTLLFPCYLRAWDYVEIVALIFFVGYWRSLSKNLRAWVCIAIASVFLNTDFVWTFLYNDTPFKLFQNPYRFDFITEFIATWVLSLVIIRFLPKQTWWTSERIINLIIALCLFLGCSTALSEAEIYNWFSSNRATIRFDLAFEHSPKHFTSPTDNDKNLDHNSYLKHDKVCTDYFPSGYRKSYMRWNARSMAKEVKYKKVHTNKSYTPANNQALIKEFNKKHSYNSTAKVISNFNDIKTIKYVNHISLRAHYINRGLKLYVPRSHMKILMPIALYKGQEYYVTNNGHKVHWCNHHNILQINDLKKGYHNIRFYAPIMWYRYMALLLTLIDLLLLWMLN